MDALRERAAERAEAEAEAERAEYDATIEVASPQWSHANSIPVLIA